jgi:hypothetical protein
MSPFGLPSFEPWALAQIGHDAWRKWDWLRSKCTLQNQFQHPGLVPVLFATCANAHGSESSDNAFRLITADVVLRRARQFAILTLLTAIQVITTTTDCRAQESVPSNPDTPAASESQTVAESSSAGQQHLILIQGAAGSDEFQTQFSEWAARWMTAAHQAGAHLTAIGTNPSTTDSEPISAETVTDTELPAASVAAEGESEPTAKSDAELLRDAISEAIAIESAEPLWIVFIGHGTFDNRTASWNLKGPDLSADELANLCRDARRPLAVIACASSTSPFINALSGPNRIVVSATKDGGQVQFSRFGDAMSKAISSLDADINRDGETSLLEAWLFASRRTAEFYKTEGRLATEHSLLDDNGDQKGTRAESFVGDRVADNIENAAELDGQLASKWAFVRSPAERLLTAEQRQQRDELEQQLEELRKKRDSLPEPEYLNQLEAILRPLAHIYRDAEAEEPADDD